MQITPELDAKFFRVKRIWEQSYLEKYGVPSIPFGGDERSRMINLISRLGLPALIKLICQYFKLDGTPPEKGKPANQWFRRNGHSLECFEKNLEQINVTTASEKPKNGWCVGEMISADGRKRPIQSHNPNDRIFGFTPIPFDLWCERNEGWDK